MLPRRIPFKSMHSHRYSDTNASGIPHITHSCVSSLMNNFAHLLLGKDRRTIGKADNVADLVVDQDSFDKLFALLFHHERNLVMRAADAVEKVTRKHKQFLEPHKNQILSLLRSAIHIELKWHIAQLAPRLPLNPQELHEVWSILSYWVQNPNESKIVRVNSIQGLFDMATGNPAFETSFTNILDTVEHEPIASLRARIKKLRGLLDDK